MQKNIFLLGATGSIGTTALNTLRREPETFRLAGVSAYRSVERLVAICREFEPEYIHMQDPAAARELSHHLGRPVFSGPELLERLAQPLDETVLAAMVGNAGLLPVLTSLNASKTVALANKETLVSGGHLAQEILNRNPAAAIIPVDSEHAAIHQCLRGENPAEIEKIILTASGGSFRTHSLGQMKDIRPEDALKHPNWDMGAKITVDSSSMMNKGLEVIEAHWLFQIDYSRIEVLVHPQSIIHSLVQFQDGGLMAQLSLPDMSLPIRYALTHGESRLQDPEFPRLNLAELGRLDFEAPDFERFENLRLAFEAGEKGGSCPCVLNAANEIAVEAFLKRKIGFLDIPRLNRAVLNQHSGIHQPDLDDILKSDEWARQTATKLIERQNSCA